MLFHYDSGSMNASQCYLHCLSDWETQTPFGTSDTLNELRRICYVRGEYFEHNERQILTAVSDLRSGRRVGDEGDWKGKLFRRDWSDRATECRIIGNGWQRKVEILTSWFTDTDGGRLWNVNRMSSTRNFILQMSTNSDICVGVTMATKELHFCLCCVLSILSLQPRKFLVSLCNLSFLLFLLILGLSLLHTFIDCCIVTF